MSVLQGFTAVLLRYAMISCRFAAFYIDWEPFCSVMHEFGVALLRSALICNHFAAFSDDLVLIL